MNNAPFLVGHSGQIVNKLKVEFEPQGFMVYPMSAATRSGIDDILKHVQTMLNGLSKERVVFESEYDPDHFETNREPIEVWYDEESKQYFIEGPGIEKMLGFTNLDSEKGFAFFQNFLKERGVLDKLEAFGINEGDTVRVEQCTIFGGSFRIFGKNNMNIVTNVSWMRVIR